MFSYIIIFVLLLIAELLYFKIADHYNIIDKPNERSSHSTIVLRGGGIIFSISMIIWIIWQMISDQWLVVSDYMPFIIGLVLIAGVSFIDDIKSLPDSVRLVAQFVAMGLVICQVVSNSSEFSVDSLKSVESVLFLVLVIVLSLIVMVGATNIINFMDGINGITGAYSLAVLLPLLLVERLEVRDQSGGFIEPSYLIVAIIGVLVFCLFNFRPRGKAKCFAGDVGSVGIAFILLFAIGKMIMATGDITYLIFLVVYGVDGVLTICHRIMLHENLGQAHRKHAYQLMANELKMSHVTVCSIYALLQLFISLGFIYLCPNTIAEHWMYLLGSIVVLGIGYVVFMKKYYHLHEEYLKSLHS